MSDYFGYQEKVCVVTGASAGMGKETARLLVEMGAEVYALNRTACDIPGVKNIPTNLAEKASIDNAFQKLPDRFDCFFGAAGLSGIASSYDETFTVDFIANKYITDTYLTRRLKDQGTITYITSTAGRSWAPPELMAEYLPLIEAEGWDGTIAVLKGLNMSDKPGTYSYTLAKRAVNGFAAIRAKDFAARDIRINCVLPCSTQTRFVDEFVARIGSDQVFRDHVGNGKPLAHPEVMAKAAVYLGSEFAPYITGVSLVVDYGLDAAIQAGQLPPDMNMKVLP